MFRFSGGYVSLLRFPRLEIHGDGLAWLIVLATIPAGLSGLALEHLFRTTLGKPIPAAAFLMINGVALYAGEVLRRRAAPVAAPVTSNPSIPAYVRPQRSGTGMVEMDD
jgi:undecaprenyl-diphosphatase